MAKLKAVLENLDDLPETQREFYTEADGKFVLDLDEINSHPNVISLKTSLDRLKADKRKTSDELNKLKAKLEAIPDDFDLDEYSKLKELKAQLDDPDNKDADKNKNAEAVAARKMLEQKIATMEKSHTSALEKLNTKLKSKEDFISRLLIDEGLTKALAEGGVQPTLLKAAKAMLRENVKVVDDGEDYTAVVDTDIGPVDVSKFVTDWIASDEGKVFVTPAKGGDAGGGNKPPGRGNPNEKNPWAKETWNLTEQGRLLRTDRVKADKMAKAAGHTIAAAS